MGAKGTCPLGAWKGEQEASQGAKEMDGSEEQIGLFNCPPPPPGPPTLPHLNSLPGNQSTALTSFCLSPSSYKHTPSHKEKQTPESNSLRSRGCKGVTVDVT